MIRTKIICTLGPACDNDEVMRGLLSSGMDCARMNFSHGSHEEHGERLARFRRVRDELGLDTAVLLDTKGPEIRTGNFAEKATLTAGQEFTITHEDSLGDEKHCSISYKDLYKDIQVGQSILFDDGLVGMRVTQIDAGGDIQLLVENGGELSSHKSVNLPGAQINLPAMTENDEKDILFAIEKDYDFIALSFVRKAADVQAVRRLLEQNGGEEIQLIAKIENQEGVDNIDDIIRAADGVMVARGDLGVEIPVELVPVVQKKIIKKCQHAFKTVIIATQMLDSMIRNPRPTRAETSDVANAIFDGASCTMLSGETANGKYPVESLRTMVGIARTAESNINYWGRLQQFTEQRSKSITDAISLATCSTAREMSARCIVTVSQTGHTARAISRFHPACPIVCATPSPKVVRQLHLTWGVYPYLVEPVDSTDRLFEVATNTVEKSGLGHPGDLLVITAGTPVGVSGTTNTLKVVLLGDALVTGVSVGQSAVCTTGEITIVDSRGVTRPDSCVGHILVAGAATEELLPLLRRARGLVVEKDDTDGYAAAAAAMLDIPVIVQAAGATNILKNGTVVTMEVANGVGTVNHV